MGTQERPSDYDEPIQLLTNLFTRVGARVFINGQGPFTFVIDTGAGITCIADSVENYLQLRPLQPVLVHGISTATVTPSAAINHLRLNGLGFRNLACPVFGREQLGADGLIGLDLLDRFRLRFDIPRRSASLSPSRIRMIMDGENMETGSRLRRYGLRSVRGRFGQMIINQVQVDGQSAASFIDSGAQYSIGNLALRRSVRARRPEGQRLARIVPVYGVTGQSLSAELARVDDLRLGSIRLGPTPLLFADLHCFRILGLVDRPALLIGADLLGRFREVILDFPDDTVTFNGLRRQTTRRLELPGS